MARRPVHSSDLARRDGGRRDGHAADRAGRRLGRTRRRLRVSVGPVAQPAGHPPVALAATLLFGYFRAEALKAWPDGYHPRRAPTQGAVVGPRNHAATDAAGG